MRRLRLDVATVRRGNERRTTLGKRSSVRNESAPMGNDGREAISGNPHRPALDSALRRSPVSEFDRRVNQDGTRVSLLLHNSQPGKIATADVLPTTWHAALILTMTALATIVALMLL